MKKESEKKLETKEVLNITYNNSRGRERHCGRQFIKGRGKGGNSTSFGSNQKQQSSCNFCGHTGHWESECLKKLEREIKNLQMRHSEIKKGIHQANITETIEPEGDFYEEDSKEQVVELNLTEFCQTQYRDDWLIDSGASSHVTGNRTTLSQMSRSPASHVTTASGSHIPIAGKGSVKFNKNKAVSKVLYVPGVTRNLLSVGQLTDDGYSILFNKRKCYVSQEEFVVDPTKVHLSASRDYHTRLYKLDSSSDGNPAALENISVQH
ncbi:unnamed protein product [Calypogeia fissa]